MSVATCSNRTEAQRTRRPDGPEAIPKIITITENMLHARQQARPGVAGTELPFRVHLVGTEEQLRKAVRVRADAFLRHAPTFGRQLLEPEPADRMPGNVVLLAESKADGEPEGSIRIETNFDQGIEFESLIELPTFLRGRTAAQVARLGVRGGSGSTLVKHALFKALYRYCLATQVDYMLVAARTPVDREFMRLGFREVFEEPTFFCFPGQGKKLLRLFVFDVAAAESAWRHARHPLYEFMIREYHPDIQLFSSVRGMWEEPRSTHSAHVPLARHVQGLNVIVA